MTRIQLLLGTVCVGALVGLGCSQTGPTQSTGSGGSSSGGTSGGSGGESSSGGDKGSGGSGSGGEATGGSESSGGVGAGGAATGGSQEGGAGGASSSGGAGGKSSGGSSGSGNGGAAAGGSGAGGAQSSGGVTAAGGTVNGGTTGSGGTATGGAGSGGVTGSGGSSAALTPADLVPDLAKGFYWEGSCMGNFDPGGHNCWMYDKSTTCPSSGVDRDSTISVKGTSGQKYTVNVEVRGVIGTRCYQGGTRASTAAAKENDYNNWWYVGGTPYNSTGWWNTYELHVSPSTGDASKDVYYFNAADNGGGSFCEREATYLVKYTASFKVVGGGSLLFRIHDNNCKAQQNCGSDTNANSACAPRTVDLVGMSPQPPSTFKQPPSNAFSKTYYPQWMWITATSVTSP
jgi:hypothetical protein